MSLRVAEEVQEVLRVTDVALRALERKANTGDVDDRRRLMEHQKRAGTWRDPRKEPEPGDKVKMLSTGIVRLVVSLAAPVLLSAFPGTERTYCIGGKVRAQVPVNPGTGEPPGKTSNWHGHSTVGRVHWRRVEGRGPRSGCCRLKSWQAWARGQKVLP